MRHVAMVTECSFVFELTNRRLQYCVVVECMPRFISTSNSTLGMITHRTDHGANKWH